MAGWLRVGAQGGRSGTDRTGADDDHRAAGVVIQQENWMRQGQTEPTSLVFHQNPEFVVQSRWWVEEKAVTDTIGKRISEGFIGFKDITSATNQRTMIAAAIPWSEIGLTPGVERFGLDMSVDFSDPAGQRNVACLHWGRNGAAMVYDLPTEARFEPESWGIRVLAK